MTWARLARESWSAEKWCSAAHSVEILSLVRSNYKAHGSFYDSVRFGSNKIANISDHKFMMYFNFQKQ